jgi:hypothetical protein
VGKKQRERVRGMVSPGERTKGKVRGERVKRRVKDGTVK